MGLILPRRIRVMKHQFFANPVLSKALDGEELLLYLSGSELAVSASSLEWKEQDTPRCTSRRKICPKKKLVPVLVTAAGKLRP